MTTEYREAFVLVQGIKAGIISETEDGYEFAYLKEYLDADGLPVSITMPLSKTPYQSTVLFPFFDGLIPEGWLLNTVNRNWKIDIKDRFGLLLAVCKDCIGDVSISNRSE